MIKLRYLSTSGGTKYIFKYCHLSEIYPLVQKAFEEKKEIEPGTEIGKSGDSGGVPAHLHFEINTPVGERLRPQFILTGQINVSKDVQEKYGYPAILTLPQQAAEIKDQKEPIEIDLSQPASTPQSDPDDEINSNNESTTQSNPVSRPKMRIIRLAVDYPKSVKDIRLSNWQEIKVREDIYDDLIQIKGILNNFGISFTCEYIDAKIDNKNCTPFGRVGLEVRLNNKAGLQKNSNYKYDDYLIGPDYSNKIGNGYKLKVYGRCTAISDVIGGKYSPIFEQTDIYSVRETINTREPQIVKVQLPLLDISKIFNDFGFINVGARANFFKFSNTEACYWNVWYKPAKIKKGTSYREALETVYEAKDSSISNANNLIWDGEKFI
jgi:hypothetical protein